MTLQRKITKPTDWSDAEMLTALHLRAMGCTFAKIGEAVGKSRSAVSGILRRIDRDYAASEGI